VAASTSLSTGRHLRVFVSSVDVLPARACANAARACRAHTMAMLRFPDVTFTIEPAPTGRSRCKGCAKLIEQGALRAAVRDAREFNAALAEDGGGHEGEYRGYIEGEDGTIAIEKYNIHLGCADRMDFGHPPKSAFKFGKGTAEHKRLFQAWLAARGDDDVEMADAAPAAAKARGKAKGTGATPKGKVKKGAAATPRGKTAAKRSATPRKTPAKRRRKTDDDE
jgi:hypothetical protein